MSTWDQIVAFAAATLTGGVAGSGALLWYLTDTHRTKQAQRRQRDEAKHIAGVMAWRHIELDEPVVGRHRLEDGQQRDPLMSALVTRTQAMFVHTLKSAGEAAPDTFGPREDDIVQPRRVQWMAEQPRTPLSAWSAGAWEQAALIDVEVAK